MAAGGVKKSPPSRYGEHGRPMAMGQLPSKPLVLGSDQPVNQKVLSLMYSLASQPHLLTGGPPGYNFKPTDEGFRDANGNQMSALINRTTGRVVIQLVTPDGQTRYSEPEKL